MMGSKVDSTWTRGASITWSGEYDGKAYTDRGEVLDIDPPAHLKHTHSVGGTGAHTLDWTLDESDGDTKLTLLQSGAGSKEEADDNGAPKRPTRPQK